MWIAQQLAALAIPTHVSPLLKYMTKGFSLFY